jgi:hypothetical protein
MRMIEKFRICLLLPLIFVVGGMVGCRHPVKYPVSSEGRTVTKQFAGTLRVTEFSDKAPKHPSVNLRVGKESWKTNALELYKDKEYAKGMARMLTEDLQQSGIFSRVIGPMDGTPADYLLLGTIWDFSAVGRWRSVPENTIIFSTVLASLPGTMISAAALSWLKTEVVSSVILTDLRILHVSSGKILWRCPPLRAGGSRQVRWTQADSKALVRTANLDLREVMTQFINRLNEEGGAHFRQ